MRALRPALLLLAATACATPTAEKMSFEGVLPPARSTSALEDGPARGAAHTTRDLTTTLNRFSDQARRNRERAPRGSAMSAAEINNWADLLRRLDVYLARPEAEISSHDVVRARLVLESELQLDSGSYGSMPPALADSVVARLGELSNRTAVVRLAKLRAARPRFRWPVEPVEVTSSFGGRTHPVTGVYRPHLGIDLAADTGQEVNASAAGVVVKAEFNEGHGNFVELDHGGGVQTRYSHLSRILVIRGMRLRQGELLGLAGATGLATGAHLHFELWRDGQPVDPADELPEPPGSVPVATR